MPEPIGETWVKSTVLIENQWGAAGTGFFFGRKTAEDRMRIILVTNKHVLHADPAKRATATHVTLHLSRTKPDGSVEAVPVKFSTTMEGSSERSWREHPDQDVDVLAFNVTRLMISNPELLRRAADDSMFITPQHRKDLAIGIAEEVLVIGYPAGLRQGNAALPLVRAGIVATRLAEPIEDQVPLKGGGSRKRVLRGFLLDGATIPGSSGSPVVLKPSTSRVVGTDTIMGIFPPLLLGIIAETRFSWIPTPSGAVPSYAGLGLAFDADTIRETIEMFFK